MSRVVLVHLNLSINQPRPAMRSAAQTNTPAPTCVSRSLAIAAIVLILL